MKIKYEFEPGEMVVEVGENYFTVLDQPDGLRGKEKLFTARKKYPSTWTLDQIELFLTLPKRVKQMLRDGVLDINDKDILEEAIERARGFDE